MAGKRGHGQPGEEGFFFSPAPPFFFPLPLGFLGGSARAPAGVRRAAQRARSGAPRVGGAGQAGAEPGAGRLRDQEGTWPGFRAAGRVARDRCLGMRATPGFLSPVLRRPPWKKLQCPGLVGPAGGVLRLAGPAGTHLRSPTWGRPRRAALRKPRGPGLLSPLGLAAAGETLAKLPGSFGLWLGASPGPRGNPE